MIWGSASMAAGLVLFATRRKFWQGLGQQFILWGLIDAVIAWFGGRGSQRRVRQFSSASAGSQAAAQANQDARTMQNLLAVNSGLDILYIAGGALTLRKRGQTDSYWRGAGWGIIIQGAFLYLFDLVHALLIARLFTRQR
jgi:hypothetical protein